VYERVGTIDDVSISISILGEDRELNDQTFSQLKGAYKATQRGRILHVRLSGLQTNDSGRQHAYVQLSAGGSSVRGLQQEVALCRRNGFARAM
jgi:hypothetical protein